MSPRGSFGLASSANLRSYLLIERILAQEVQRFAKPLAGVERALAGIGLGAFAAAPEHVDLRAQFDAEIDRAHRLVQRIGAHLRIVAGEGAIAESRIAEEVGGRHRHDEAGVVQRLLEIRARSDRARRAWHRSARGRCRGSSRPTRRLRPADERSRRAKALCGRLCQKGRHPYCRQSTGQR